MKHFVICTSPTSYNKPPPFSKAFHGLLTGPLAERCGRIEQTTTTILTNISSLRRRGWLTTRIEPFGSSRQGTVGKKAGHCKSRKLETARRGRLRELRSVRMCSFLSFPHGQSNILSRRPGACKREALPPQPPPTFLGQGPQPTG